MLRFFGFEGCGAVVCGVKERDRACGERGRSGGTWHDVRRFRVDWCLARAVRAQHLAFPPLSPPPLSAPAGAERGARIWLLRAGYAFSTREVAVRFFWLRLGNLLS